MQDEDDITRRLFDALISGDVDPRRVAAALLLVHVADETEGSCPKAEAVVLAAD
jgi:anthranilate phosphoribosyltransferase